MAVHDGVDTVAFVTGGYYTETYTSATDEGDNIADLFCSYGLLENVLAIEGEIMITYMIEEYGKVLTTIKIAPANTVTSIGSEFYQYTERYLPYTSGGTTEIVVGDWIVGQTGNAVAHVKAVTLDSGTWAGGDAAGTLTICSQNGTFESEKIAVGAGTDEATITADSIVRQDNYPFKEAEARAAQLIVSDQTALACWDGAKPDQTALTGMKLVANTVIVMTNYDSIKNFKVIDYTSGSTCTVRGIFYF